MNLGHVLVSAVWELDFYLKFLQFSYVGHFCTTILGLAHRDKKIMLFPLTLGDVML